MVLIRVLYMLAVAGAVAGAAGCGQSLFDAHGDRARRDAGTGDDDASIPVPVMCPDECVGDAAADFDEAVSPWRYLEEGPSHQWLEMAQNGAERSGLSDMRNTIRQCRSDGTAAACKELPDALLVTAAGESGAFYPAVELKFTGAQAQVLHLIIRAHVPEGSGAQHIRLYRNGREDVLYSARGVKGATVAREVIVDALPGDRFLASVEPAGTDGGSAALQFFVSKQGERFPSTCLLAASFETAAGAVIEDLCTNRDLTFKTSAGAPTMPMLPSIGGAFLEQGNFIRIPEGNYMQVADSQALVLARNDSLTIQFWVRVTRISTAGQGFLFSDLDGDLGGGVMLSIDDLPGPTLVVSGAVAVSQTSSTITTSSTGAPPLGQWFFVRLIDTPSQLRVCVDGSQRMTHTVTPDRTQTIYPAHLGREAFSAGTPLLDGSIDDLRVLSGALPCD
ncbi:MAG TPA: LamG-like jellyroll fold domain-containing protein [Kofleriaceae bacterium]|nr:LamG-like jellyroll fold domain-containing protein [Kofleriaceae bacterium]